MLLDHIIQDVRYGVRSLRKNSGFTAVALLTLALGIGANTAIFSVVNAVLLAPLPYADVASRVMVWSRWKGWEKTWVSDGELLDYRRRSRTLSQVAAWSSGQVNLTGEGEPERVGAAFATANTFATLGARPLYGRTFTEAEDFPGRDFVAVLGYGLWQRRYGGDRGVIGRTIRVNGRPRAVVGVMPRGFQLPTDFTENAAQPSQLWLPLAIDPKDVSHGNHGLYAAAQLAPGATAQAATHELKTIAAAMTQEGQYPGEMQFEAFAVPIADEVLGDVRPAVLLLFGAVGFLLLIACANVANLLLARAESRQREVAVRTALGAGGARLFRQLLTESVLLSGLAAIGAVAIAYAGTRALAAWNPEGIPRATSVVIDTTVLAFTAGIALLTSVVFSLVPGWRALHVDLTESLREGGQSSTVGTRRQHFRNVLVVGEMALAVVLLIGAGLMIRSLWSIQRIDLGFDPEHVLTLRVSPPETSYESPERVVAFYEQLVARIRELPGVEAAGALRSLPLGGTIGDWGLDVEGFVETPGNNAKGDWQVATDGAIEALRERLVRGRAFTPADRTDTQQVAIVNETMARAYWKDGNAIGGRIKLGSSLKDAPWVTVVGIVADVRHNGVTDLVKEKFYRPHSQFHKSTGNVIRGMTIVVRTSGDPLTLAAPVKAAVARLDPNLPVADLRSMTEIVAESISTPRFTGFLLTLFAALALTLSAVGIYGVLTYLVSQRTREIGIRVALGAGRAQIVRLVLGRGVSLAVVGVVIGVVVAAAATRAMTTLLHGVTPLDPLTFATVAAALSIIAAVASYIPAHAATRIDPLTALKAE